ncbi:glycoside hydrolase family 26 protein [Rhizobium leucaenae]|uniref:Beta-mannanase n=1 Tax=Rhizobium leucaenae TaxID=29450 RepID=A0A7W6ZU39_9HYPH|nr:glycosyl hydrolase [Rhizobium leucaenae]MBB4568779.1 beta-mannanase [Rhizobium leucaenae]MBB6302144.1 beta-mannanase [Rhizobium leucaenae]
MSNRKTKAAMVVLCVTLATTGTILAASIPRGIPTGEAARTGRIADKRPKIGPDSVTFGAYDPHGDFKDDPNSKIEHIFLPWEDVDLGTLSLADDYAQKRGRKLLITVEPWSWAVDWRSTSEELLQGILAGRYDSNMAAVCETAATLKSDVTIRWAQEMDETDNQFIWSHWKPSSYVAAYRRMVNVCREHDKSAKYMWSPKGEPSLTAFYPGDDVVDIIGLSVFGLQQFDRDHFGADRTFAQLLAPKYRLVQAFNKPVVVAELGYEGDSTYVANWAANAAKQYPEFPKLTAVVYFNDKELYPWPKPYGLPNWRVVKEASF